ncbi:MAG: hypothetical protein QE274_01055 [Verrucomicrobiaceae bacterium]|nr:hypothetical protein [Verrucomicrobiaceae bacterium]
MKKPDVWLSQLVWGVFILGGLVYLIVPPLMPFVWRAKMRYELRRELSDVRKVAALEAWADREIFGLSDEEVQELVSSNLKPPTGCPLFAGVPHDRLMMRYDLEGDPKVIERCGVGVARTVVWVERGKRDSMSLWGDFRINERVFLDYEETEASQGSPGF